MSFLEGVLINVFILVIITQGVYLLTGMTGLFSLGQAAFVATGAYAAGIVATRYQAPFLLSLAAGVVASVVVSLVVGYPSLKLRRVHFSLATIAFGYGIESILNVSTGITGGAIGLIGIPNITRLWHVLLAAFLTIALVRNFKLCRYGRACVSTRTDEVAAQVYGVNAFVTKEIVFAFAAGISGLAGGLLAFYLGYLSPDMFGIPISAEYLIMVFFGGLYSQTGVILGTIFLALLMEMLRATAELRMVLYCTIILIFIIFRPTGVFGTWEFSRAWLAGLSGRAFGPGVVKEGVKDNGFKQA
ncbi:MAG TPA: branched-chain amino acid ABC transporter permease [Firmicutes bacterium]|nr:branched-chain amino acid ABC transporter permease [Bacillota bacterium]